MGSRRPLYRRLVCVFVLMAAAPAPAQQLSAEPALGPIVSGLNWLTLRLFQQMEGDGSVVLSGQAIAGALALAAPGARGATRAEFERLLPLKAGDAALAKGLRTLLEAGDDKCVLGAANGAFVDDRIELLPAFVGTLTHVGAAIEKVPFSSSTAQAKEAIDRWAREHTRGRINELAGDVNARTRLVLASALHFSADWAKPFSLSSTGPAPFRLPSGEKVDVPMMRAQEQFRYGRVDGVRLVELPYACGTFSLLLMAPDRDDARPSTLGTGLGLGGLRSRDGKKAYPRSPPTPPPAPPREPVEKRSLASIEASLTPEKLAAWAGGLESGLVHLTMPRFQIRTSVETQRQLERVGLRNAFTNGADFSGITRPTRLQIDAVSHRTVIEVDEAGTRAASAAAVVLGTRGTPQVDVAFDFDRPFLFALRQNATGAILLFGRVADPREWADGG